MASFLIRVEGVNFDASIFDTADLSTIRGASLALLRMDAAVEAALRELGLAATKVFSGASQCAFTFEGDDPAPVLEAVAARMAQPGPRGEPFPQVTVVADAVAVVGSGKDAIKDALARAEARNRTRQFRQWTTTGISPHVAADDADKLDRIRPATESAGRPGRVLTQPDRMSRPAKLSAAVLHRRAYGRTARQKFYEDELGVGTAGAILGDLSFTNSLDDMVHSPPVGLPLSLQSKVAVVYADGNGFGAIRDLVGINEFSDQLAVLRRALLADVLRWLVRGQKGDDAVREDIPWQAFAIQDQDALGLRFETLLWGGDEFIMVMPAWLAFAFVSGFCAATKAWEIKGNPLTHAVGVAIAHHKTPIRQLKTIAKGAADMAKDAGLKDRNSVSFEIYESLSPPDLDLRQARARLYRATDHDHLARLLAIPGEEMVSLGERLFHLTGRDGDEPFPRSQLYAALRNIRDRGLDLTGADATKAATDHLKEYARRAGGKAKAEDVLRNPLPCCDGERPTALDLALICQLWDYTYPFGTPLATFAEGGI